MIQCMQCHLRTRVIGIIEGRCTFSETIVFSVGMDGSLIVLQSSSDNAEFQKTLQISSPSPMTRISQIGWKDAEELLLIDYKSNEPPSDDIYQLQCSLHIWDLKSGENDRKSNSSSIWKDLATQGRIVRLPWSAIAQDYLKCTVPPYIAPHNANLYGGALSLVPSRWDVDPFLAGCMFQFDFRILVETINAATLSSNLNDGNGLSLDSGLIDLYKFCLSAALENLLHNDDYRSVLLKDCKLDKLLSTVLVGIFGATHAASYPMYKSNSSAISHTMAAHLHLIILVLLNLPLSQNLQLNNLSRLLSGLCDCSICQDDCLASKVFINPTPSLSYLAKYWGDPIREVRIAARSVSEMAIQRSFDAKDLGDLRSYWLEYLPIGKIVQHHPIPLMYRSAVILGMVELYSQSDRLLNSQKMLTDARRSLIHSSHLLSSLLTIIGDDRSSLFCLAASDLYGELVIKDSSIHSNPRAHTDPDSPHPVASFRILTGRLVRQLERRASPSASSSNSNLLEWLTTVVLPSLSTSVQFEGKKFGTTPASSFAIEEALIRNIVRLFQSRIGLEGGLLASWLSEAALSTNSVGGGTTTSMSSSNCFLIERICTLLILEAILEAIKKEEKASLDKFKTIAKLDSRCRWSQIGQLHLLPMVEALVRLLDPSQMAFRVRIYPMVLGLLIDLSACFAAVALHRETQRVLVGGSDGLLVVYDLRSASRVALLEGMTRAVSAVAFEAFPDRIDLSTTTSNTIVSPRSFGSNSGSVFSGGSFLTNTESSPSFSVHAAASSPTTTSHHRPGVVAYSFEEATIRVWTLPHGIMSLLSIATRPIRTIVVDPGLTEAMRKLSSESSQNDGAVSHMTALLAPPANHVSIGWGTHQSILIMTISVNGIVRMSIPSPFGSSTHQS